MNKSTNHGNSFWIYLVIIIVICSLAVFLFYKFCNNQKTLLASGHPEWSPVMWQSGDSIIGAGPELVQKICTDLKIKCDIKYEGQWQEVQDKVKNNEVDMLVAAYKTTPREQYMDYSVAYTDDPITLFIKNGVSFPYQKWDDLVGKKGVVMIGDSYGQEFDEYIAKNLTVDKVATTKEAFDEIINGKADYFVYALYSGKNEIKKQHLTDKIQSIPNYVAAEKFYITISKNSPFAKYLSKINELIKKYQADGTIDKLMEKNISLSNN